MTKMSHFILCLKYMSTSKFTQLFIFYIIKLHSLLNFIILDHSFIFMSKFVVYTRFDSEYQFSKVYHIPFSNK